MNWSRCLALTLLGLALSGCTTQRDAVPTSAPAPSLPAPSLPPASPPAQLWNDEQQLAVDAVQAYWDLWNTISQSLPDSDVNQIHQVAGYPAANDTIDTWLTLMRNGLHSEGVAVFTAERVDLGPDDELGERYYVYGCLDASAMRFVRSDGTPLSDSPSGSAPVTYTVLQSYGRHFGVIDERPQEGQCSEK
jgi:hypothetical protein